MKCSKHPNYKAILQPQCKCVECWVLYAAALKRELNQYKNHPLARKRHKLDCRCDYCD